MYYEVGTHIDLSHLNQKAASKVVACKVDKPATVRAAIKKASDFSYEVGTQFIFNQTTGKFSRRINVQFA
jgi:hypothetical protein